MWLFNESLHKLCEDIRDKKSAPRDSQADKAHRPLVEKYELLLLIFFSFAMIKTRSTRECQELKGEKITFMRFFERK